MPEIAEPGQQSTLSHHILRVGDLDQSLAFYCGPLGMDLVAERRLGNARTAVLAFGAKRAEEPEALSARGVTLLVLRQGDTAVADRRLDPRGADGYWKIGITLADVDMAREILCAQGHEVSEPRQFRDIDYLCHLVDPDGFQIELLQHRFAESFRRPAHQAGHALGGPAGFGQITLRVRDPEASLAFYGDQLGLRLLSRQKVEPYSFTLYFLAYTDEQPPCGDLDAVENREWLWQRPYTTLELQHRWGMEAQETPYRSHDSQRIGFEAIGMAVADPGSLLARLSESGRAVVEAEAREGLFGAALAKVRDPDGYSVHLLGPL